MLVTGVAAGVLSRGGRISAVASAPMATSTSADTETDSTTGPPPMCSAPDGTYGAEPCPDTDPFCVGGMCTACNNAVSNTSCFEHDEAPGDVCAADGRCVVCTPDEDSACELDVANPYCDPETNECAPCSEHAHCGMAACNLFNGQCVPGMVVTVLPGPGALVAAVNAVTAAGGGTIIVNEGTYDEAITINSNAIVGFLAEAGASPEWRRTSGAGAPQLRVTGGATVLVDGIDFRLNNSSVDSAIRIDSANSRFWADRSTIAQNFGVGVRAEGSAELRMRNCFVGGANNIDALEVITSAIARVRYSTLGAAFSGSNAISCDATATVTVSDSILIAADSTAELACDGIDADHIVTNTMVVPGTGNMAIGSTDELWFVGYGADFHLMGDGVTAFATLGEWNADDPTVDIDGDPRPTTDPSEDYVGADIP